MGQPLVLALFHWLMDIVRMCKNMPAKSCHHNICPTVKIIYIFISVVKNFYEWISDVNTNVLKGRAVLVEIQSSLHLKIWVLVKLLTVKTIIVLIPVC